MAEVLAAMVVGPLLSMVKEKASSYLLDKYKVMEGMENQHKLLKRKLPAIIDVIADAEEQAAKHREGAKAWLEEVRMVAYKANDVLDEFKYEALRRKAKDKGHYKALGLDVIKLFPSHNRVVFRYKMAKRLCMILQEIDDLIAEMNAFRFKFKPQPQMPMQWRQTDASTPKDTVEIASKSRAKEKKDLVDILLAQASSVDLMVLPIVGMGGLGKTTLAQLVYNDPEIQKHFELQLWVCVSDDFDVGSLADRIVKENGCEANDSSALNNLQNAVSGKRYLLVLDDVWNRDEHKWGRLKSYLQHGGSGSSVLATTRDEAVANLMMGKSITDDQRLKDLGEVYMREIIGRRAFGSKQEDKWPRELVGLVGDMVKRCSGSPLAATALGSILHTKTSSKEWEDVLNGSTICDEENGILPVLKLSYNCLPSYMRQCFAFCAMFPKDYEIDVEMLIQLWMANGFIPEKQGEHPEIIGKNIFVELASRSFFQDVKGIPFQFSNTEYSRVTCKIHDLMHDVAVDSMGNECTTITNELSKTEDFPFSARHLFLSDDGGAETLLNASQEKGSPAFQTLVCESYVEIDLKILSKYNSIRALKINSCSILRPKYLHHLRYLDLSRSDIPALPEGIGILYHLQTLNLYSCHNLERLPNELKYLTSLRHLYTGMCEKLKSMPAELGHLTSLQTLTYFVACTDSGCSNVDELQNLDLGGELEISQLGNVTGADAQAASLENKKRLTKLELVWDECDQEAQNNNHKEVVEGLKPHDGLKVLWIRYCGSSTFPTWMNMLSGMVELHLWYCKKFEGFPALWELPALQILHLVGLERLRCLCSGGITPVIFLELKVLHLHSMPNFEAWSDIDVEVQGEVLMFPKVEDLIITECESLTALPKAASVISGAVDTNFRSAFPALRKMVLNELHMFGRWEAGEGTVGDGVTFPQLEELSIKFCGSLSALPKGSLLAKQSFGRAEMAMVSFPWLQKLSIMISKSLSAIPNASHLAKQSFGGAETVCRCSAFPALRKLKLSELFALERWGAAQGTSGEEATFPLLVDLAIDGCPMLTDLPEAPKLSKLHIQGVDQQISLQAASRYIPTLSNLTLDALPRGFPDPHFALSRWNRKFPLPAMWLTGCNLLFSSHPSAVVLWTHFAQLVDLEIWKCDALVYWPRNVFQVLVCLRNLRIYKCSQLTGHMQASDEQAAPAPECGGTLPCCLESLGITECESLVQVPILPASLKTLDIYECSNVQSIVLSAEGVVRPDTSSLIPESSCSEATVSTAVLDLSSAANHHFLPCLESLSISKCASLSEVVNLPPSMKTLDIFSCENLRSLSGQLDVIQNLAISYCSRLESLDSCLGDLRLLEELELSECKSLVSLPDGPQAYSSLRVLEIANCDGIELLPPSLQSRLDYLEKKEIYARCEDLPEPKTLRRSIGRLVNKASRKLFPCSRDEESDTDSD